MLQKLEPGEADKNRKFFEKACPKFELQLSVIELNGRLLVYADGKVREEHSNTCHADMFRADSREDVAQAAREALQWVFQLPVAPFSIP